MSLTKRWLLFALVPALVLWATNGEAQPVYAEHEAPDRGVAIAYTLSAERPVSHIYDIEMAVTGIRNGSVDVVMPAWSPGAYAIRNYARNVQDFRAATPGGRTLDWKKSDKHTWRVMKGPSDDVLIRYQVFSAQLTDELADISGPATFMYVDGHKHVTVRVRYRFPGGWKVHTGLDRDGDRYVAPDYDVFVDAPAFAGKLKVLDFKSKSGIPHELVFSNPAVSLNPEQVLQDVQDIVEAGIELFGGAPYKRYVFLFKVQTATGSGGLEHLNSTRITVGENDFTNQNAYRRFLFVVAHEYFHLWNIKRIRPTVLGPFDYTREAYTRLLWVSEGITSYYANLLLMRSGIITPEEYLARVATEIQTLQRQPGRLMMSAEEASWDTWLRSDNGPNNTISYYNKGELVGMLLDLEIRSRTRGAKSLDDVMRHLKAQYSDKGVGFPEDGFQKAVETIAGSDFDEFMDATVRSRAELDYNRYLKGAGLRVDVSRQPADIYVGIEFERGDGGVARIRRVVPKSPAERAGLDSGDVLVALNADRLTFDNFRSRLHSRGLNETVTLTILRGERLMELKLTLTTNQAEEWRIEELPGATPDQIAIRKAWIAVKEH